MLTDFTEMMAPRSRDNLRLRPGMHVTCPHCNKVMLKCIKQPVSGDSQWHKWFEEVCFRNNRPEAMPWCPFDGWLFYDPMNGVHTKEIGWTF